MAPWIWAIFTGLPSKIKQLCANYTSQNKYKGRALNLPVFAPHLARVLMKLFGRHPTSIRKCEKMDHLLWITGQDKKYTIQGHAFPFCSNCPKSVYDPFKLTIQKVGFYGEFSNTNRPGKEKEPFLLSDYRWCDCRYHSQLTHPHSLFRPIRSDLLPVESINHLLVSRPHSAAKIQHTDHVTSVDPQISISGTLVAI